MAARGDDTRSRSPRDPGAPSSAQGVLRTLDIGKMQLTLESRSAKVLYFKEDDIWFEAKPLLLYLDYSSTNVSQTLGLVRDKNKKSLKELLDTRGTPKMVDWSDQSTPGYHELKASYVNKPGLYSLIFRSTKRQAQEF
jgi:prophage antirepressor-like protein